jgi:hypothetical protein
VGRTERLDLDAIFEHAAINRARPRGRIVSTIVCVIGTSECWW